MMASLAVTSAEKSSAATVDDSSFLTSADYQKYYAACGRFWPLTNQFETFHAPGTQGRLVSWKFSLSDTELKGLKCLGSKIGATYMELDLSLHEFQGDYSWDDYQVLGTNIPHAMHDAGTFDLAENATPGVTNILVSDLKVDKSYYATLYWRDDGTLYPKSGAVQRVSFEWVPSHWATWYNPTEGLACILPTPSWCIFGTLRAFVSGGFWTYMLPANADGLPFDPYMGYGVWNSSPSSTSTSSTQPTSGSWSDPPPEITTPPRPIEDPPRPVALQYGSSELSVLHRDADTRVHKDSWNGTAWSGFDDMGGNLLGLEVTADDVAQAFVSLAKAPKTTGAVITVDGGNIAAALR